MFFTFKLNALYESSHDGVFEKNYKLIMNGNPCSLIEKMGVVSLETCEGFEDGIITQVQILIFDILLFLNICIKKKKNEKYKMILIL